MTDMRTREGWLGANRPTYLDEGLCFIRSFLAQLEMLQDDLDSSRMSASFEGVAGLSQRLNLTLISGAVNSDEKFLLEQLGLLLEKIRENLESADWNPKAVNSLFKQAFALEETADKSKNSLVYFRDLEKVDDASLSRVLEHVEAREIGLALVDIETSLGDRLVQILSYDEAREFWSVQKRLDVSQFEIRRAQICVRNVLRGLVSLGKIRWRQA